MKVCDKANVKRSQRKNETQKKKINPEESKKYVGYSLIGIAVMK